MIGKQSILWPNSGIKVTHYNQDAVSWDGVYGSSQITIVVLYYVTITVVAGLSWKFAISILSSNDRTLASEFLAQ